ncbi:MAG TPA: glycosyltransferase family 2 protein [Buttiauxella sp.]|jgi:hypothetical protein
MQIEPNNFRTLIVLLNWNGAKLTLDCCDSLSKLSTKAYDILVIDNHSETLDFDELEVGLQKHAQQLNEFSTNSSQEHLLNEYQIDRVYSYTIKQDLHIMLASSLTNHGFARGCNFGVLFANQFSYSHVLLLNNDTIVEKDFLEKLFLHKKNYNIVIPQIRFFEPSNKIWNCGGEINNFGKRKYFFANKDVTAVNLPKEPFSISFATGCCMLIETSFYIESGMFTEDFFFGEEDIDYALRLNSLKAKVACVPESIIYHKVGASLAGDLVKLRRKAYIHFLNRFINMKNHLGLLWFLWIIPATLKMALNLNKIYELSIYQTFSFCSKIISASLQKNKVEKEYFEKIMKVGY